MKIYVVVIEYRCTVNRVALFATKEEAKEFLDKSTGGYFYGMIYKRELPLETKKKKET